ncbi:MAG: transketolase [Bacillota bacterium]|nr:transketolase [Bacillota bacterium]
MLTHERLGELNQIARRIRSNIVTAIYYGGSGHPGGSLSCVEILTALYFHVMNIDPENPGLPDRDRFILSKAHAAPALYATLTERGYFPKEWLKTFSHDDSRLQKHIDMHLVPGVDVSGGSLGQGLSIGVGMALAARIDQSERRIFVCLGDGELDEGQNWEAAMSAAHYKLNRLTAIVDRNCLQVDGTTDCVMNLEPLEDKWRSFGFHTLKVDGHDVGRMITALDQARQYTEVPTVILAQTVKGKGISFIENRVEWHAGSLTKEQADLALAELREN